MTSGASGGQTASGRRVRTEATPRKRREPRLLLDPKRKERYLAALRLGATQRLAAVAAGVGESTADKTLARARAGDPKFKGWAEAVAEAEATSAIAALDTIRKAAADGDWKAAAWLLERRHGYARPAAITVTMPQLSSLPEQERLDLRTVAGRGQVAALLRGLPPRLLESIIRHDGAPAQAK